jgi:hypothetical protein
LRVGDSAFGCGVLGSNCGSDFVANTDHSTGDCRLGTLASFDVGSFSNTGSFPKVQPRCWCLRVMSAKHTTRLFRGRSNSTAI